MKRKNMDRIKLGQTEILSNDRHLLRKVHFEQRKGNGDWQQQVREVYDHGNAATVLLYNPEEKKVVLTRQFRLPAYLNGHPDGYLLETCAGLLEEGEAPAATMQREILEETGYEIGELEAVGAVYTSAGSLTEKLFLFLARYRAGQKKEEGGGLEAEGENLEVLTLGFEEVNALWRSGGIEDAKMLLLVQHALLKGIIS